jgi:hypothetical protein
MRRLGARCQQREHLQLTGGQLPGRARHRLGGASPLALYGVGRLQHPARQPSSTPRAEGPCRGGVAGESPRRPESARPSAPALAAHRRCPQRKSTFCRSFRVALRGPFGPGRVSASKLSFPVSSSVAIWCTHRGRHPGTPARPDPVPAAGTRSRSPAALSCPGRAEGTVVPAGRLRKIPPAWAPSGDAHGRRRFVPSYAGPAPRRPGPARPGTSAAQTGGAQCVHTGPRARRLTARTAAPPALSSFTLSRGGACCATA